MLRRILLVVAVFVVAGGIFAGPAGAFTLVKDGRPAVTIVTGLSAAEVERQAAAELQVYLREMSGASVPVMATDSLPEGNVILIGQSQAAKGLVGGLINEKNLGYDGYIIKTFPKKLVLVGNQGNGTRYAVFSFLELLGCRFYLPDAYGEVIPHKDTIATGDLNIVSKPDFIHRAPWNNGNVAPTLTQEGWNYWNSWFVKNKLGGVNIGHGHNYAGFVPPSLFESHPEYFSLVKGERISSGQICTSNPEVVRLAVEAARRAFDSDPSLMAFSLSPNDTGGFCECENCRKLDDPKAGYANRILTFNNQVAEEVWKTHPGKLFAYYGEYGNMPGPPIGMKAHPGVMPAMVNIYCLLHDINDPTCPSNVEYRKRLKQWHDLARQLFMYEWYAYSTLPTPENFTVGPRIKYYKELGFLGYSGEILNRSPDTDLSLYIAAELLWDADQDPKAMLGEFFRLYFGEAAEEMREYYELFNEVGRDIPNWHFVRVESEHWQPRTIARLRYLLALAMEKAREPAVKERLEREGKCLEVITLVSAAETAFARWHPSMEPQEAKRMARLGLRKAREAIDYLRSISGEDIVAEQIIIDRMNTLINVFTSPTPVKPDSARYQAGWSDEETFGDLWEKYTFLADAPLKWKFRTDPDAVGEKEKWFAEGYDDGQWAEIEIKEFWEPQGYYYDGWGWYRVRMEFPEVEAGRKLILYFGAADEVARVWVNGKFVGTHDLGDPNRSWDKRFPIDITRAARPGEENLIAVAVHDSLLMGGLWKSVKLVTSK